MGNSGFCGGRGFPSFIPPNTEHVTYVFDYLGGRTIGLCNGTTAPVADNGFLLESRWAAGQAFKWHTIKEYSPSAANLSLCVSGRVHVRISERIVANTPPQGLCAFKVCTRGRPVFESIKTETFTHTAAVVTCGVFFGLYINFALGKIYLCPRIVLTLECGDEVTLVGDQLGPIPPPLSFYTDFAIVDDGGRNIQMDLIFRGEPRGPESDERVMQTLRTCLQDYTTFNNQVQPASISVGYSNLASVMTSSDVHVQNLQISERRFEDHVLEQQPCDVWKELTHNKDKEILFEGEDARLAYAAIDVPEAPNAHPQLQPSQLTNQGSRIPQNKADDATSLSNKLLAAAPSTSDYWHHIRYNDGSHLYKNARGAPEFVTLITGEFWLSKNSIDKKNVYFHCSSTLAQALTTCIVFRFSCPIDYLNLIETRAANVLCDTHIPTNGVVLGIENDPRHDSLLRMFIEHRNEIMDDMVICECPQQDLMQSIVHQEVYDGGSTIIYRITLLHGDGTRQSAVLQVNADQFEDANLCDSGRYGGQYQLVEEPSSRFPITPCLIRHNLSASNRIFVYSSTAYEAPDETGIEGDMSDGCEDADLASLGGTGGKESALSVVSDATMDDWHSAGGGCSDMETDQVRSIRSTGETKNKKAGVNPSSQPTLDAQPRKQRTLWQRPLIESIVLLKGMQDPPFSCFPTSLS